MKMAENSQEGQKVLWGKRRNCSLREFFSFSRAVFSKDMYYGHRQSRASLGKRINHFLVWKKKNSLKPFQNGQNLHASKLKEFVDDNSKFDENGRKFSKKVENTVGKGEIARYEQFLLCPLCFQKTPTVDT